MQDAEGLKSEYDNCALHICQSIYQHVGLYPHHLGSFEHLLSNLIPQIIQELSPVIAVNVKRTVVHKVFIENPTFVRPSNENEPGIQVAQRARDNHVPKLTLLSEVRVRIRHKTYHRAETGLDPPMILVSHQTYDNVTLFEIPVMDGSELTNDFDDMDQVNRDRYAGTMTVNGYRKVMIVQARRRTNFPFVTNLPSNPKYSAICSTRSAHRTKFRSPSATNIFLTRSQLSVVVKVPFVPKKVPITVILRLLGVSSDKEMISLICGSKDDYNAYTSARNVIMNCPGKTDPSCDSLCAPIDDLYVYVAVKLEGSSATGSSKTLNKRTRESHISSMKKLLASEILPHIGADLEPLTLARKASFIGMAVGRILALHRNAIEPDEEESCVHKRYSSAGPTLAVKLRQLVRNVCKMLGASITRNCEHGKHVDVLQLLRVNNITRPLRSCLAKGNFSVRQNENSTQAGVCQVQNSMNRISRISHMTTVNQQLSRDGPQTSARKLRTSHFGIICPHTPDGKAIGLVQHHTLFADFRRGQSQDATAAVICSMRLCQPLNSHQNAPCLVFVNDEAVARTADPDSLVVALRKMRSELVLAKDVTIFASRGVVYVNCDDGEAVRPVLRADKVDEIFDLCRKFGLTMPHHLYPQLLASGCLEYISKAEEETLRVATSFRELLEMRERARDKENQPFTHFEIDPSVAMFGAVLGLIPFLQCNQGPRNIYSGAMVPQSIGAKHPMFENYQLDVQSHVLHYPQKQLTRTLTSQIVQGERDLESISQVYMVAILPGDGLNLEDAIVGNRQSNQRGLGHTTKYTNIRDAEGCHPPHDRSTFVSLRTGQTSSTEKLGRRKP